jgi:hypothetical protein
MAHAGENDWRGVRPGGLSAADLFDPAELESRLVEARARRARALAARGEGAASVSNRASPAPLGRGWHARLVPGVLFVCGVALGSISAVVATQTF